MDEAFAHNSESNMMDLVEDIKTKMISNDLNIRPKNFKDVIGQDDVKEYLRIKISAFQKNNISIGHLLFLGFSGAGKTTMANVMANEMQVGFHQIMATRIKNWNDFYQVLKGINANDVIFIDEIHALAPKIQEQLYGVMEDFVCTLEDKNLQKQIQVRVPRFTLIGATTHTGELNAPLLSRFQYKGQLLPYTEEQLEEMVATAGKRMYDVHVPAEIAKRIAKLSRRTARTCYNLLRSFIDVVEADNIYKINSSMLTMELLYKTLRLEQIDPIVGLDYASRKYLVTLLRDQTPIGSRSLASMINEQESTLLDMIEPFLLSDIHLEYKDRNSNTIAYVGPFAKITKKGRVPTEGAFKYIKLCKSLQGQGWFSNESLSV
jgi:Holliday junction DNA helicase RuvB